MSSPVHISFLSLDTLFWLHVFIMIRSVNYESPLLQLLQGPQGDPGAPGASGFEGKMASEMLNFKRYKFLLLSWYNYSVKSHEKCIYIPQLISFPPPRSADEVNDLGHQQRSNLSLNIMGVYV